MGGPSLGRKGILTRSEFHLFLEVAMGICAVMVCFNLLRYRTRKNAAFVMAGAFAALGLTFFALFEDMSQVIVGLLGFLVVALIVGDFVLRAGNQQEPR